MLNNKELTFNKFYVVEFLQEVLKLAGGRFTGENSELIDEMIGHLQDRSDVTEAIEIIAQEQGSGELSIFLFDIVDRIEDYPPSVAYDALPDIVDDFINGLELMLEEEETVNAIKKVNAKFREIQPEMEIETPAAVPAEVPEPPKVEEEEVKFEQFYESDLLKQLKDRLATAFGEDLGTSLYSFSRLMADQLDSSAAAELPDAAADLSTTLAEAFPWKVGSKYQVNELAAKMPQLLNSLSENLEKLNAQSPEIITVSLDKKQIVVPEKETRPEVEAEPEKIPAPEKIEAEKEEVEFRKEEVPEEPTTIDTLLAEYFQSEVSDHLSKISDVLTNLKNSPTSIKLMKEAVTHLQSFNEISMIHGYLLIESFCGQLIELFNNAVKEKLQIDIDAIDKFGKLFELLKRTENLRDPKAETAEARELENLARLFESNLFTERQTGKRPKAKKPETEITAKEAESEVSEQEPEPGLPAKELEEEIHFENKEALIAIIAEYLHQSASKLFEVEEVESAGIFLSRMHSAAKLIGSENIAVVIAKIIDIYPPEIDKNNDEFRTVFAAFCNSLNSDLNQDEWVNKFGNTLLARDLINIKQDARLLEIIAEIENRNLQKLPEDMQQAFGAQDQATMTAIRQRFAQLGRNLILLKKTDLQEFADFYHDLFSGQAEKMTISNAIQSELQQSFKLFVQALRSGGKGVDIAELLGVLKEVLQTGAETAIPEETPDLEEEFMPEKEESAEVSSEEDEEDLQEIFRQEAESSLLAVANSIEQLETDLNQRNLYQEIERNVHSLKSSARLMGNNEVADLAAPLEAVCEKLASPEYRPTKESLAVIREGFNGLKTVIDGGQIDQRGLIAQLSDLQLKKSDSTELKVTPVPAKTAEKEGEKPLFAGGGDEDDDLLEIFKEESGEFIKQLEEASETLSNDPKNIDAIKKLENASHSLKSPAKMLGFSEIGQIGDAIEIVAESAGKGDVTLNKTVVGQLAAAIDGIKSLTAGVKLEAAEVSDLIRNITIDKLAKLAPETEEISGPDSNDVFIGEARDLLDKINKDLIGLEKEPEQEKLKENLRRYLHTLKGGAQILGFDKIGRVVHLIEEMFDQTKNKAFSDSNFDTLYKVVDGIGNMVDAVKQEGSEPEEIYQELVKELDNEIGTIKKGMVQVTPAVIKPVEFDKVPEIQKDVEQTIKITTDRLDTFVNMAAELVVNKTQLADQLEKLRELGFILDKDRDRLQQTRDSMEKMLRKTEDETLNSMAQNFNEILQNINDVASRVTFITQKFDQNINQISHLTKSLHDDILQVRMVPTEVLFNRFPRAVRDLAKKQRKKINLLVEGEDTEMDRAMIESLTDPVMHLVRNAVDHGIESPKIRKKQVKNEDGIILLKARRDKNQVIIEVHDDGKGLDPETIKKAILKKKLVAKDRLDKMTTDEILDYIFHPGFTTKTRATEVSGRGVGLDAVAETIQKLRGDIRVNSTPQKGTIFSIRLPLTLAITQALIVAAEDQYIAVPLNAVEETRAYDEKEISAQDDKPYLKYKGEKIPLLNLADYIKYGTEVSTEKSNILVVQDGLIKYAILTGKALRKEEIVVRSLGDELKEVDYIAGGTIFGDGSVVLILDVASLTREVEDLYFAERKDFSSLESARKILADSGKVIKEKPAAPDKKVQEKAPPQKPAKIEYKKIVDRKPAALIVDDSLSVRKFVSSVLERNSYITTLANDGPEALEELEQGEFDIIITDLEMPKMQGFELIEKIRELEKFAAIPIVILTGKAAKENKEKGIQSGANAYIVKPFKENDLLKTLEKFISIE